MKRLASLIVVLGLAAAIPAARAQSGESSGEKGSLKGWEWANFVVLAGALGYLAGKNGSPFFAARSGKIRQDMTDAAALRKDAETRAAEIERRLANLESDIAALRGEAKNEAQADGERIARQTAAESAKIQANAEQEIASAAKAARTELRRYAAQLAVELAERQIRARMTPDTQDELVRGFVDDLDHSKGRGHLDS
jgi:F-type H+-transporting ATPase subunit b